MNPRGWEVNPKALEQLCACCKLAAVLVDADGRISWSSAAAAEAFPGVFCEGKSFQAALEAATLLEPQRSEPLVDGELRSVQGGALYRHFRIPLEDPGPRQVLHGLADVSHEHGLRDSIARPQAAHESLGPNPQERLQTEKLSAVGGLAAHVSHEIRNPLMAIGGLARSLLKDLEATPETAETLQVIVSEVTRLESFLRETLDFVKPPLQDGAPVDLSAAVLECLAVFKNELPERAITLDIDLPEQPIYGQISSGPLHHTLSNLLKNAIEAMTDGGRLHVAVGGSDLSATIRVGDTGAGIPPEALPHIFDPYFTTKPEGTGLGLSIAQQNIRSLGGMLEVETDAKFSSVFKLTLPLAGGGESPAKLEESFRENSDANEDGGNNCKESVMTTVLVADDELSIRKLYERELADEGYSLVFASDAQEAIQKAKESTPDLVIMDVSMPGMDGIEAMGRLLDDRNELPVVINTAHTSHKESFLSWPAAAYVTKSSDLTELKDTVRKILTEKNEDQPN